MSIPYVVDGETELDSLLFNPIIDRANGTAGPLKNMRAGIFNVLDYGAVGDGTTNDRTAIQAAIDDCLAGGDGTVYFPGNKTYRVQITETGASDHLTVANTAGVDITFLGGPGAVLDLYTYGGDPDDNWQVLAGVVHRGHGIHFRGAASWATRPGVRRVIGLEMNGNYTNDEDSAQPPNTGTGRGWDTTHKALCFEPDTWHDSIEVRDCRIHHWSGESIYGGGNTGGYPSTNPNVWITSNVIENCIGSMISISARQLVITGNELSFGGTMGIEYAQSGAFHVITHNYIHDMHFDGICDIHFGENASSTTIAHNQVWRCDRSGIALFSAHNSLVESNIVVDCATGINLENVGIGNYPNDTLRNCQVSGNIILADTIDTDNGISIAANNSEAVGVRILDNIIGQTVDGAAGGFLVTSPFAVYPSTNLSLVEFRGNRYLGAQGDNTENQAFNVLLESTSETTVASYVPAIQQMLQVMVSVRVVTATTNVTIAVASNDLATDSVTTTVQSLTALAVGTYTYPAILVPCARLGQAAVKVTAGTADQVYVTATIREA